MTTVAHAELAVPTGFYEIDPTRSRVGFTVRSLLAKVHGSFTEVAGTGFFDPSDPAGSTIELHIAAASIDTRNAKRDAHLRSKDFFGVDKHPEIVFTSTAVQPIGGEHYRVTGSLTIKGATRPVTVLVRRTGVPASGEARVEFEGSAVLHRSEWGVRWNRVLEAGGLMIADKVHVEFTVSAVCRQEAVAGVV